MKKKEIIAIQVVEIERLTDLVMGYASRVEIQSESIRTLKHKNETLDSLNKSWVETAEQGRLEIIELKTKLSDQQKENERLKKESFVGMDFDGLAACLVRINKLHNENEKLKENIKKVIHSGESTWCRQLEENLKLKTEASTLNNRLINQEETIKALIIENKRLINILSSETPEDIKDCGSFERGKISELQTQLKDNKSLYEELLKEYNKVVKVYWDIENGIRCSSISDDVKRQILGEQLIFIRIF